MTRHYQQLTYDQRCQIYTLKKTGFSQRLIAQEIGVNQSTVSRELSRNAGRRGYRYQQAHRLSREPRALTHQRTKMTPALLRIIEGRLGLQWSPEQISGWLRGTDCNGVSHESIYLHIWRDKRAGGDLYRQLRRQGKKYDKRRNGVSTRGHIKNRQGIEKRPSIVDQRIRLGDWEIDTVIGKKHQGAIVTIVERSTQSSSVGQYPIKRLKR